MIIDVTQRVGELLHAPVAVLSRQWGLDAKSAATNLALEEAEEILRRVSHVEPLKHWNNTADECEFHRLQAVERAYCSFVQALAEAELHGAELKERRSLWCRRNDHGALGFKVELQRGHWSRHFVVPVVC